MLKLYKKFIFLGLTAAVAASQLIGCANIDDTGSTAVLTEAAEISEIEAPEAEPEPAETKIEPRFRQYILEEEELVEPQGFRGDIWIVIGKNGYLYENGYVNEYLGSSPKYVNVTDDMLNDRVDMLKNIQEDLESRGIAFCVVISPSKAGSHPEFIPDYHIAEYPPLSDNYVRPYIRFLDFLIEKGVYHVDSQTVYKSIGMTKVFPRTGIHWNLLASFETIDAIVTEYERQRGFEVRRLIAESIISQSSPYAVEQDIFGIIYGSKEGRQNIDSAIVDERYYAHDLYLEPGDGKPKIGRMLYQGGSFTGDFSRFFGHYGLAESVKGFYYNNNNNVRINWGKELRDIDFVILEVNEQNVYDMGGAAQTWGDSDMTKDFKYGPNIIDSLWEYLDSNPD